VEQTIVIVGASHAAAQAVDSLRREGFAGRLVLVGDEPYLPYQRPPLSKKYLSGECDPDRLWIRPASFYEQQRCELRLGRRATAIDCEQRQLQLDDGTNLAYDTLLLATGSRARPSTAPGADLAHVHYLRTRADVDAIRGDLAPGRRVVVVGGGYIGLECAAACAKLGLQVTVIEMADRVMSRVVAPEMSAFYEAEHAAHGVDIRLNAAVSAFEGRDQVTGVSCIGGAHFPADLVVVGIGILPNVETGRRSRHRLRQTASRSTCTAAPATRTSTPSATACSHPSQHYGRRIRLESVDNAFEQAKTAAANICGRELQHDRIPWFWSDQYDHKLQIVGLSQDYDRVILRGDPATRSFSCCYLRGEELIALDAVNLPRDFMAAKKVIAERAPLDLSRLADASVSLKEVATP
jgi:3-phenylpropionate/trans-cinnamate dioxygenase ferredoxin reductase component